MQDDEPSDVNGLPARSEQVMRLFAGALLAWPWFDAAGMSALRHWFFPASRLWAAARTSGGDVDAFLAAVPLERGSVPRRRIRTALQRFEEARAGANAIEAEWHRVFFGPNGETPAYRAGVEASRRELRHAYNATRRHFRFLVGPDVPRVKLTIATPDSTEAVLGALRRSPDAFYRADVGSTVVERSADVESSTGSDCWLRFASPYSRFGDLAWARVHSPPGIANPPTVIYGHGIFVEFDHWRGLIDECHALVRLGFRVIRPEAAWHGRRVRPGSFGGEPVVGNFPSGIIDALTGAVCEWEVLARWARETSRGPIVFAGSSLGALTSQLAADRARSWPEDIRPSAMLLITHTGDLTEAIARGALADMFASPEAFAAQGWTEEAARGWLGLLEPGPILAVPPQNIVSVLGRRDVILPYRGGQSLAERWCVPTANSFVFDKGHFSVPMTLVRDDRPLRRLAEIVAEL